MCAHNHKEPYTFASDSRSRNLGCGRVSISIDPITNVSMDEMLRSREEGCLIYTSLLVRLGL